MTEDNGDIPAKTLWHVTSGEQAPDTVERLLRLLPAWFGIEESTAEYIDKAHELPAYLAWPEPRNGVEQQPAGALLALRHFPCAAEIYLLAVDPGTHRRGAGRALVEALEADLKAEGVEFLQVKTLGPSRPDVGYDRTRQFYIGMGFSPLEEITGLWEESPCLIMVKSLSRGASA